MKIAEDVINASKNSFKSFVCRKNELISHYRSRRQGSWVGDIHNEKDVYLTFCLWLLKSGSFNHRQRAKQRWMSTGCVDERIPLHTISLFALLQVIFGCIGIVILYISAWASGLLVLR